MSLQSKEKVKINTTLGLYMLLVNSTYIAVFKGCHHGTLFHVVFNLWMGNTSFSQILDILVNTINNTDVNSDKITF